MLPQEGQSHRQRERLQRLQAQESQPPLPLETKGQLRQLWWQQGNLVHQPQEQRLDHQIGQRQL